MSGFEVDLETLYAAEKTITAAGEGSQAGTFNPTTPTDVGHEALAGKISEAVEAWSRASSVLGRATADIALDTKAAADEYAAGDLLNAGLLRMGFPALVGPEDPR